MRTAPNFSKILFLFSGFEPGRKELLSCKEKALFIQLLSKFNESDKDLMVSKEFFERAFVDQELFVNKNYSFEFSFFYISADCRYAAPEHLSHLCHCEKIVLVLWLHFIALKIFL